MRKSKVTIGILLVFLLTLSYSIVVTKTSANVISLRPNQTLVSGVNFVKVNFDAQQVNRKNLEVYLADPKARYKAIPGIWEGDAYGATFKAEKFYPARYVILNKKNPKSELIFEIKDTSKVSNINNCIELTDKIDKEICADKYVVLLALKNKSVKESLKVVKEFMERDVNGRTYCHSITHNLGEMATHIFASYADAALEGDRICVEGYYHGIMEAYQRYWDDREFNQMLTKLCSVYTPTLDKDSCSHGIGHMVMSRYKNNFQKSIALCQTIPGDLKNGEIYRLQDGCITGVSMQWGINYSTSTPEQQRKLYPSDDSPVHICDTFVGDDLNYQACYADITNVYYYEKDYTNLSIKACRPLTGSKQIGCYQSLAMYMHLIPNTTVLDIGKACATAPLDKAMWRCFSETVTTPMGTIEPRSNEILCSYSKEIGRYDKEECTFIMNQKTT